MPYLLPDLLGRLLPVLPSRLASGQRHPAQGVLDTDEPAGHPSTHNPVFIDSQGDRASGSSDSLTHPFFRKNAALASVPAGAASASVSGGLGPRTSSSVCR